MKLFRIGNRIVNCDRITYVEHVDAFLGEDEGEPKKTRVFFGPGDDFITFYDDEAATVWNYFTE